MGPIPVRGAAPLPALGKFPTFRTEARRRSARPLLSQRRRGPGPAFKPHVPGGRGRGRGRGCAGPGKPVPSSPTVPFPALWTLRPRPSLAGLAPHQPDRAGTTRSPSRIPAPGERPRGSAESPRPSRRHPRLRPILLVSSPPPLVSPKPEELDLGLREARRGRKGPGPGPCGGEVGSAAFWASCVRAPSSVAYASY